MTKLMQPANDEHIQVVGSSAETLRAAVALLKEIETRLHRVGATKAARKVGSAAYECDDAIKSLDGARLRMERHAFAARHDIDDGRAPIDQLSPDDDGPPLDSPSLDDSFHRHEMDV